MGYRQVNPSCGIWCLLRSLLIGQLPRARVHLSHEPSRWGGVRQAGVRQPWKAGPEHVGWLICDKARLQVSTNTGTAYSGLRCTRREFEQVASLPSKA